VTHPADSVDFMSGVVIPSPFLYLSEDFYSFLKIIGMKEPVSMKFLDVEQGL
jgi:hypothetical protein